MSEVLRIMDEAVAIFGKGGSYTGRSSKVMRDILASVRCYSEVMKEGKKEREKKRNEKIGASQRL